MSLSGISETLEELQWKHINEILLLRYNYRCQKYERHLGIHVKCPSSKVQPWPVMDFGPK
jgi:hypothetical protein